MSLQAEQEGLQTNIQAIIRRTLEYGGAAVRLSTFEFLPPRDAWEFPKYPSRTRILAPHANLARALFDFITTNEAYLHEPDCWLGTWIHPRTREFYLDITTSCPDLEQAIQMAETLSKRDRRGIVAIYNSLRGETLYLKSETSEVPAGNELRKSLNPGSNELS